MRGTTGPPGAAADSVAVVRIGESLWLLCPTVALTQEVVHDLRDAFLESVDAGAQDIVVDLSGVDTVAPVGAATLLAMADLMWGRNGTLWLATGQADDHVLRAVEEEGGEALAGVSVALDVALAELAARDLRKSSHAADLRDMDPGAPLRARF